MHKQSQQNYNCPQKIKFIPSNLLLYVNVKIRKSSHNDIFYIAKIFKTCKHKILISVRLIHTYIHNLN